MADSLSIVDSRPLPDSPANGLSIVASEPLATDDRGFGHGLVSGSSILSTLSHPIDALAHMTGIEDAQKAKESWDSGDHYGAAKHAVSALVTAFNPGQTALNIGKSLGETSADQVHKAVTAFGKKDYEGTILHAGTALLPILAPATNGRDLIKQGADEVAAMPDYDKQTVGQRWSNFTSNPNVQEGFGNVAGNALDLAPMGVAKAVGAVRGGLVKAGAPEALRASAEAQYDRVLAATTKGNKLRASRIVPELIDRGITGSSLKGLAETTASKMDAAGDKLESTYNSLPSNAGVSLGKITNRIKTGAADDFTILDSNGKPQAPSLVAENGMGHVDDITDRLAKYAVPDPVTGELKIPIETARNLRQFYDNVAKQAGRYDGKTLADQSIAAAHGNAADAIRQQIGEDFPQVAADNAEFQLWSDANRVIGDTLQRRVGQTKGLGRKIMKGAGQAAGFVKAGPLGAAATGAAFDAAEAAVAGPRWNTASAVLKNKLAEAVAGGRVGEISYYAQKIQNAQAQAAKNAVTPPALPVAGVPPPLPAQQGQLPLTQPLSSPAQQLMRQPPNLPPAQATLPLQSPVSGQPLAPEGVTSSTTPAPAAAPPQEAAGAPTESAPASTTPEPSAPVASPPLAAEAQESAPVAQPTIIGRRVLSKEEMIQRGADGYLSHAVEENIPVSKVIGREPTPAMEGGYQQGTKITQPIEVTYDPEQGYILSSGNHRITQAEVNGQSTIPAFVEYPTRLAALKRINGKFTPNLTSAPVVPEPAPVENSSSAGVTEPGASINAPLGGERPPVEKPLQPGATDDLTGQILRLHPSEISADPVRFQFKQNSGQNGVGEESRAVTKWDPEKAGVVSVWKDPADGKTYVVNGHNRLDMANRLDAPYIDARYLDAGDAQTARTKGALINIAEGRGTALDAAKVFRDSGLDESALTREGISMKGQVASQGLALANLEPAVFSQVVSGDIPVERAVVIGKGVPEADQRGFIDMLDQREKSGKRLTNDQVGEMIRLTNEAPKHTETQDSLFGSQEMTRSLIPEKAEVSDFVRRRMAQEHKLFSTVGTESAANQLSGAGNVIKAEENAQVAEKTGTARTLYDKLSTRAGSVSDALDEAAQEIAKGGNANAAKERAYGKIKTALIQQAESLTGKSQVSAEGPEGNAPSGTGEAGTASLADIRAYAAREGISEAEAIKDAKEKGYQVEPEAKRKAK